MSWARRNAHLLAVLCADLLAVALSGDPEWVYLVLYGPAMLAVGVIVGEGRP